ncbi:MAG TPA: acetyl-CoA carboxylase biotin carboxyl carrier protein subunit [Chitinophagaceae bacterium]|nr:acetyl-CoA carboxylase biotin carboxyl carrier protein subunit [Chitinophagaceae bacterium]
MPDSSKLYQVKANEFLFSLSPDNISDIDILQLSPTEFNIIKDHRNTTAKILEVSAFGKKLKIEIDGHSFTVEIKDELDQVLQQMGFGSASNKAIKEIKAPMPGLVLEIVVADGQEVRQGDKILILEAMKMENSIMIHADARIKKIGVIAGQAVEKGQVLVELE